MLADFGLELREVDIADTAVLMEAYGVRIPVLHDPRTQAELGWPFGPAELHKWLRHILVPNA